MIKRFLATLCACGSLAAATYTEGDFGFDAEAADNWAAMKALEAHFAAGGDGDTITFTNGIYNIISLGNPFVAISGRSDFTIDAPGAWFREVTWHGSRDPKRHVFRLTSCTNVSLTANFEGRQYGVEVTNSISGVRLVNFNTNITVKGLGSNLWDFIRIGDYNGGVSTVTKPQYNITVATTNWNCEYGVIAYLANDLIVTNRSEGLAVGGFSLGRATYLQAITNATIVSRSKNSAKTSHVNLLTTGGYGGDHFGCENVTIYATDEGSTYHDAGTVNQILTGTATQRDVNQGIWDSKPVTHRNIAFHIDAFSSGTVWTNRRFMSFGTLNMPELNHRLENIRISGSVNVGAASHANNQFTIEFPSLATGLKYVDLALENFTCNRTYGHSVRLRAPNAEGIITSCSSSIYSVYLYDPNKQSYIDLGACTDEAPATVNIGALGSYAYQPGSIPQSFRVYSLGHPDDLEVNYNVTGTAVNGVNYEEILTSVTIPAGQTYADVVITPRDIGATEDATVTLTLQPGTGYTVLESDTATITIRWSRPAGAFGGRVNLRGQAR